MKIRDTRNADCCSILSRNSSKGSVGGEQITTWKSQPSFSNNAINSNEERIYKIRAKAVGFVQRGHLPTRVISSASIVEIIGLLDCAVVVHICPEKNIVPREFMIN